MSLRETAGRVGVALPLYRDQGDESISRLAGKFFIKLAITVPLGVASLAEVRLARNDMKIEPVRSRSVVYSPKF
jgi:hypothetical protein